ncbi:MAG: rhamnogalacturonan acetylesterase [Candidatus Hydrogenedentes bacterium]|nr:rhamnogalacturonan acetylesterase [Candidatus Hydrogenedentota bacterium]
MLRSIGYVVTFFLFQALMANAQQSPSPDVTRLYVIGDSTAASYTPDRAPLTGWAQDLQEYFDATKLIVEDKARSGRSSKSFIEEGAWDSVRDGLKKGDYVFIQFGHNDATKADPKRFTEPETTYREFMKRYVDDARAKGAIPVLVTSINRNQWADDSRTLKEGLGEYPAVTRKLAEDMRVTLIDLEMKTRELFQSLGPEKVKGLFLYLKKGESPNYPEGKEDSTHLREAGAREVAKLAVAEIRKQNLPIAGYLK